MKIKVILLSVILLAVGGSALATTTVTGTLQNLGTGTVGQAAFVRFWLRGCGGNQPRVNGTAVIAPSQGGVFYFDFAANASGNISGTLYSTRDVTGLLGGDITCGTSTTSVWYGMQVFVGGKGGPETPVHALNTATLNISSVTPITVNPVVAAPTGDSTYLRKDAGNSPVTGPLAINSSLTVSGTGTFTGPVNAKQFENTRYADQFSGADIFAQANAAIAAACPLGQVVIPPGTYNSVTTTLTLSDASDNCTVIADGVKVNFTNTTGTAVLIQHTSKTKLIGNLVLIGPGAGTSSKGIQLGGTSGTVAQTIKNYIGHINISAFGKAFVGEGTSAFGGTYFNTIEDVHTWINASGTGNGQGFYLKPTNAQWFNANTFINDSAQWNTTDGWVIDGANNMTIFGGDSENNACGFRIGDTQTTIYSSIVGTHLESNSTADFCSTTPANINQFLVSGVPAASTTVCQGAGGCRSFWANTGNIFQPSQAPGVINPVGGTIQLFDINANSPAGFSQWTIFNGESPASGITSVIDINRAGANNGNLLLGTPEYPITFNSAIKPGTVNTRDLGTAALPWRNLILGTAATNNFTFAPAATAAARTITINDPLGNTSLPLTIASGTKALPTASVTTATCDAGTAATATGTLSTDTVDWSFNAAPTATNKYGAFLVVYAVPSANTVTFYTCNPSATTSTPTAMTVNWSVRRP